MTEEDNFVLDRPEAIAEDVKLAIIYYSSTGANYQLAQWVAESASKLGAEVKVVKVQELAPQSSIDSDPLWKKHAEDTKHIPMASVTDLEWADAIIFSSPTRYGNVAAQLKHFMDSTGSIWAEGKLTNKVVSAMSSPINSHGGQESATLALHNSMYHWGAMVVAPGYSDPILYTTSANPHGTNISADPKSGNMTEDVKAAVFRQTKRTVTVADWIKREAAGNIK